MTPSNSQSQSIIERLAAPTYTQLWGVDAHLRRLTDLLTAPDGPQIITIEGTSGIGKTALVHALIHHLLKTNIIASNPASTNDTSASTAPTRNTATSNTPLTVKSTSAFADYAWITACQTLQPGGTNANAGHTPSLTGPGLINGLAAQLFGDENRPIGLEPSQLQSMVTHHLAEQPRLIVIDNVETSVALPTINMNGSHGQNGAGSENGTHADAKRPHHADTLIEVMREVAAPPTRLLITTQPSLFEQADILHYPLGELNGEDALALIRGEAKQRNRTSLASASDNELRTIYQAVGGNPLALRLMASLPSAHALQSVLTDLAQARSTAKEHQPENQPDQFYTRLYQHAWNSLNQAAREAWLLMPIVADNGRGMALAHLAEIAQEEPAALYQTLEELVTLNLIDRVGEEPDSRYAIHTLARRFLQDHVLSWSGEMGGKQ